MMFFDFEQVGKLDKPSFGKKCGWVVNETNLWTAESKGYVLRQAISILEGAALKWPVLLLIEWTISFKNL